MTDEMNEWRDLYRSAVIALRRIEAERDEFEDRATQAESERDGALSRVERLEEVEKAARRVIDSLPSDRIETARDRRKKFPGSGGDHFISHARLIDLVDALAALSPPEYPPEQM